MIFLNPMQDIKQLMAKQVHFHFFYFGLFKAVSFSAYSLTMYSFK